MLDRIASATEEQARSTVVLVELQRNMVARLEQVHATTAESASRLRSVDDHLERMDNAREKAVRELKNSIDVRPKNGARLVGWILAGAATVTAAALTALAVLRAR